MEPFGSGGAGASAARARAPADERGHIRRRCRSCGRRWEQRRTRRRWRAARCRTSGSGGMAVQCNAMIRRRRGTGAAGAAGSAGKAGASGSAAGAGGSAAGAGGMGGAGSGGTAAATFTQIYAIFMASCAGTTCHVNASRPGDMLSFADKMTAYTNLVNVNAVSCSGEKRVVPNDPAKAVGSGARQGGNCTSTLRMPTNLCFQPATSTRCGAAQAARRRPNRPRFQGRLDKDLIAKTATRVLTREIHLVQRPEGELKAADFKLIERDRRAADGQVLSEPVHVIDLRVAAAHEPGQTQPGDQWRTRARREIAQRCSRRATCCGAAMVSRGVVSDGKGIAKLDADRACL